MRKIPTSETNPLASTAVFNPVTPDSVRSRIPESDKPLPSNGHNLETLRDFSPISHHDDIDKIGIATHLLSESASKYSKSGMHAAFMKQLQTQKKPNK